MCCFSSPRWLNVEQDGGQERLNKSELRQKFRKEREDHKKNSLSSGLSWGEGHLKVLTSFFRNQGLVDPLTPEIWPFPWAAYYPIGSELNLLGCASNQTCWLPADQPDGSLLWYRFSEDVHRWEKNSKSLPHPPASQVMQSFEPARDGPWIVLTPCLAADASGTRLGYGGGYYDRFLEMHGEEIFSIACVPSQLFFKKGFLPREKHDQIVDCLATEKEVICLNKKKLERVCAQLLNKERG